MKAKKSLGQNFLIDDNIIKKIASSINAKENDLIIEIGPGMGALTKELKLKKSSLICYEIDKSLSIYLNKLEDNNLSIIYEDILKANIKEDIENIKYDNLYVVGNLPYYITTPIIKHLINSKISIDEMIFMVQEEVADRFTAKPKHKEYSAITLFLNYYYHVTKLFKVSKNSFSPRPKVESAIISLKKRIDKPKVNEKLYMQIIRESFSFKRKTLKNNLSNYNYEIIKEVLNKYDCGDNTRAEELPEEFFVDLANQIENNL